MKLTLYCSDHKKQIRNLQKIPDVLVCSKTNKRKRCEKSVKIIRAENLSIGDNVEINKVSGVVEKFIGKNGELFLTMKGREGEYPFDKRVIDLSWKKVPLVSLNEIPRYVGERIKSKNQFQEEVFNLAIEGMSLNEMTKKLAKKFEKREERMRANIRLTIWRWKRDGWAFYPSRGSKFIVLCGKGKVPKVGVEDE